MTTVEHPDYELIARLERECLAPIEIAQLEGEARALCEWTGDPLGPTKIEQIRQAQEMMGAPSDPVTVLGIYLQLHQ